MEKINIAELLKDCPSGMELDSTNYSGVITFEEITDSHVYPIKIRVKYGDECLEHILTKYGQACKSSYHKCVIFPKGKTTWEGFVPPVQFKNGDIISDSHFKTICIFKGEGSIKGTVDFYCGIDDSGKYLFIKDIEDQDEHFGDINGYNFTTEEEKQKLFDTIKANGYKWNAETKTLEKLIEPKFDITTLKPFESRVLVRDKNSETWVGQFFSYFDASSDKPFVCIGAPGLSEYKQCLPYEGNEHLIGKTNDCDEFYKTWE